MINYTQAQINQLAKEIRRKATEHLSKNDMQKSLIDGHCLRMSDKELFEYCIAYCRKPDAHLIISYILDQKSSDFGNQQDANNNTLHHHAARDNNADLMHVLNEQKSNSKRILYGIRNKEGKTALDICCEPNHEKAFAALWPRAGKSTHKDCLTSLMPACVSANQSIIETILAHKKILDSDTYQAVITKAKAGFFESTVNQMITNFAAQERAPQHVNKN